VAIYAKKSYEECDNVCPSAVSLDLTSVTVTLTSAKTRY